jgi:undecaprenyl pyrophosphate synthase
MNKNSQIDLADVSPKMEEVQTYFVSTINQELKSLEKNRSLETETIIENALDQLEDLEDDYNDFVKDLNKNTNPKEVIAKMISNYQKRLEILENTLQQIEYIKNPNLINDEIYL